MGFLPDRIGRNAISHRLGHFRSKMPSSNWRKSAVRRENYAPFVLSLSPPQEAIIREFLFNVDKRKLRCVSMQAVVKKGNSGPNAMSEDETDFISRDDVLRMAVDVVAAYLSNNQVAAGQIPEVIHSVFNSLTALEAPAAEPVSEPQKPAAPIRKSVHPDYIICLEDGKKLKMLKRHLRTTYNMTPEEYRAKWNLPADYPMVAPNYARQRSDFAKQIGLGRKARERGMSRRG